MTELPQSLAPGCFGKALAYNPSLQECNTCPFAARCEPEATVERTRLQEKLGLSVRGPVKKQTPKPKPEIEGAGLISELPVKVVGLLHSFERIGVKITEKLAKGENPFATEGPVFMRLTCHLLLHYEPGVDRPTLLHAMKKKLEYTDGTASALSTQAIQALIAVGAVTENNGKIFIRRS